MKQLLIAVVVLSIAAGSVGLAVSAAHRIQTTGILRPVEKSNEEKNNVAPVQPTAQAIPTFPPLPEAQPTCQPFVDRECFENLRPTTQ